MTISIALLSLLPLATGAPQDDPPIPADTKIITTDSGLQYSVLQEGQKDGLHPQIGDTVKVHYTGWLTSGKVFDSSAKRGPAEFMLGQVIAGWNEGLGYMSVGSKFKLTIPWKLAYGEQGRPPVIPAKADLIFAVELLGITPGEHPPAFQALEDPKTTESGLKYQVLSPGEGDAPTADEPFELGYAFWTTQGKFKGWHNIENGPIRASSKQMNLAFLKEAPLMMKPGAVYLFEVPPALAFGERAAAGLDPNTTTIWRLEMLRILRVPSFAPLDEAKTKTTPSGLKYEIVEEGTGKSPKASDSVTVHYAGWFPDGKGFDSSYKRGQPSSFPLTGVIAGWTEGLQLMKEGAKYKFYIPWPLAYGERGRGNIPPKADLVFLVELIKVGR